MTSCQAVLFPTVFTYRLICPTGHQNLAIYQVQLHRTWSLLTTLCCEVETYTPQTFSPPVTVESGVRIELGLVGLGLGLGLAGLGLLLGYGEVVNIKHNTCIK